jgi:hypothetical protein
MVPPCSCGCGSRTTRAKRSVGNPGVCIRTPCSRPALALLSAPQLGRCPALPWCSFSRQLVHALVGSAMPSRANGTHNFSGSVRAVCQVSAASQASAPQVDSQAWLRVAFAGRALAVLTAGKISSNPLLPGVATLLRSKPWAVSRVSAAVSSRPATGRLHASCSGTAGSSRSMAMLQLSCAAPYKVALIADAVTAWRQSRSARSRRGRGRGWWHRVRSPGHGPMNRDLLPRRRWRPARICQHPMDCPTIRWALSGKPAAGWGRQGRLCSGRARYCAAVCGRTV